MHTKSCRDDLRTDTHRSEIVEEHILTRTWEREPQAERAVGLHVRMLMGEPRQILGDHNEVQRPLVDGLQLCNHPAVTVLQRDLDSDLFSRPYGGGPWSDIDGEGGPVRAHRCELHPTPRALARLVVGYERSVDAAERLGAQRVQMAIVTSLFHDSGYIRHEERDSEFHNGAEFTLYHVSRSADFLRRYLPGLGMSRDVGVSSMIVHFTGFELDLDEIELDDPRDAICGHLLGTADLIAQMADRCYLEKCRDRLYKEFVLGGIAVESAGPGEYVVRYESGIDLLRKTPGFYQQVSKERLELKFNRAYRYVEVLYDGSNPYVEAIKMNLMHLLRVVKTSDWRLLRRSPPYFLGVSDAVENVEYLVHKQLAMIPAEHAAAPGYVTA